MAENNLKPIPARRPPALLTRQPNFEQAHTLGCAFLGLGLFLLVLVPALPVLTIVGWFYSAREWRCLRRQGRVLGLLDAIDRITAGKGTLLAERGRPMGICRLWWVAESRKTFDPDEELQVWTIDSRPPKKMPLRNTRRVIGDLATDACRVSFKGFSQTQVWQKVSGLALEFHGWTGITPVPDSLAVHCTNLEVSALWRERERLLDLQDAFVANAEYERAHYLREQASTIEKQIMETLKLQRGNP